MRASSAPFDGQSAAVSVDGGLIVTGEPIGASGLRQVHELVLQLRGTAGERQVPGTPWAPMSAEVFEGRQEVGRTILAIILTSQVPDCAEAGARCWCRRRFGDMLQHGT